MSLPTILWLNVIRNPSYDRTVVRRLRGDSTLYVSERRIAQRLEPGDEMCLWSELDGERWDHNGGMVAKVESVRWNAIGQMEIEFPDMAVAPSESDLSKWRNDFDRAMPFIWDPCAPDESMSADELDAAVATALERGGWSRWRRS